MPRCRQAAAVRIEPDNTIATLSGMRTGRTTSAQAVGGRRLWAIPGREESHDRTAKRWLERAIDREEGDVAASALRRHPVPTNEAVEMPKYLYAANYTKQGLDGVRSKGAKDRAAAIGELAGSMGGTLEGFYFAFGEVDAYVLVDLPDDETAAAVSLAVTGSGAAQTRTIRLLTTDEVDTALSKSVPYRPPGQ